MSERPLKNKSLVSDAVNQPWYRGLGDKEPPLFPARTTNRLRVYYTETDDKLRLTDLRGIRRFAVWCGSLLSLGLVVYILAATIYAVAQSGRGPISPLGVTIVAVLLTSITVSLLSLVLRILRIHRRFTVTVDIPRRTCVCRNRLFGWPIKRLAITTDEARWEILPLAGEFTGSDRGNALFLSLVLLVVGPLGWIALLVSRSMRHRRNPTPDLRELIGLVLFEGPDTRAVVLMDDETAAQSFLLAWDRHFPSRV